MKPEETKIGNEYILNGEMMLDRTYIPLKNVEVVQIPSGSRWEDDYATFQILPNSVQSLKQGIVDATTHSLGSALSLIEFLFGEMKGKISISLSEYEEDGDRFEFEIRSGK